MRVKRLAVALCLLALAACDEDRSAQSQGGGPGSSVQAKDVTASGDGFCNPQGGDAALGQAAYTDSSTAKVDTDGSAAASQDATGSPYTSGTVNGQPVDSSRYAYVVMSKGQMAASGVALGDWAKVTNNATGQSTYARVEDIGPEGGSGEVSMAAASAVGIQYQSNSFTVGNPTVTVSAYAGTSGISSDCAVYANNS
jgi:hypothetical protein